MKKTSIFLLIIILVFNFASCSLLGSDNNDSDKGENTPPVSDTPNPDNHPSNDNEEPDKPVGGSDDNKNLSSKLIKINSLKGYNEAIFIGIDVTEDFSYRVYYRETGKGEYFQLDDNLVVESDGKISCYVLGIKSGNYDIKIEAENKNGKAIKEYSDIKVSSQDRSGYAHFNSEEGIGAYNNDGTIKDNTKIIYVTNENKNTVSLIIDGEEYVGLVNILQAQYKSDTPMLIRIIGKITTNQWNYKNVEPRLADGSNADDSFFENTFSTEYGENLANLIVKINDKGAGQTLNYRTTPTGLTDVRITGSKPSYTVYKGTDFPALKGKSVYEDDSYYNMLEVKGSKNITIEGIGSDAEIFQFGISFEECNSIEVKNLTFTAYPEDAVNFLGDDRSNLGNFSRYWVHNCTFNRGYNAWDITGERDKYAGDGTIDFNCVSNATLAYNLFNNNKKTMLFGSGDSQACMNFTMHHNYFYNVESRLPLGRNVNIHSYNNYFSGCKNVSDIRQNSYLFSENNYFESTSKPFIPSSSAVKSFGDIFVSSSYNGATIVTDRNQVVNSSCKPDGMTDCSNFDTNSDLFYYDSTLGKSDVAHLLNGEDVPDFVLKHSGAGNFAILP